MRKSTRRDGFAMLATLRVTFSKKKKQFLDMVLGSVCTKFQACIFFSLWPKGAVQADNLQ